LNLSFRQKVIIAFIDARLYANTKNKAGTNHSIYCLETKRENLHRKDH